MKVARLPRKNAIEFEKKDWNSGLAEAALNWIKSEVDRSKRRYDGTRKLWLIDVDVKLDGLNKLRAKHGG